MAMTALAFDTHKAVKSIADSGISEQSAEAVVTSIYAIFEKMATKEDLENLRKATKIDLENLRNETKADLEAFRKETKSNFEKLRAEFKSDLKFLQQHLTIYLGGLMVGAVAILATLMKIL